MGLLVHPIRPRRGFTLLETMLAIIIIGVGITALMELMAKGTMANASGTDMTIAVQLANNIHEMTYDLHYMDPSITWTPGGANYSYGPQSGQTMATWNDITDLNGQTFGVGTKNPGPIDARRQVISGMSNWTQSVSVQNVDPNHLTSVVPNGSTGTSRVTVSVSHLGNVVYSECWLVVNTY